MEDDDDRVPIVPGHGLGFMSLGASLQGILSAVKADYQNYPAIDVHYSQTKPLTTPIIVNLPKNGIRLRFDAVDQRLRLIEVLDFSKSKLTYKGSELLKQREDETVKVGPPFRRVYQLFGAAFPGEYLQPPFGSRAGTYVLSWPGVAFTFSLQHSAYSPDKDHVALLGSSAAGPVLNMAVFEGKNWSEIRNELFTKQPSGARSIHIAGRPKDALPAEIEYVNIGKSGELELVRRAPAPPFLIKLNETSPEDLIVELGAPNTLHKRDNKASTTDSSAPHNRTGSMSKTTSNNRGSQPSSYSSTATDTYDIDFETKDEDDDPTERAGRDTFWCYFDHGMDILVGPPSAANVSEDAINTSLSSSSRLVVTKVILHGNIPGSYAFNRHRRIQWSLAPTERIRQALTSEMNFETEIKPRLLRMFAGIWPESEMTKGKVVNRTWSTGPNDSSFFLPDAGEDLVEGGGSEQWLGNTRLYHFPGLAFEVMEHGAVTALTVGS